MPYIKQELRDEVNPTIEEVIESIVNQPTDKIDGMLNYTITKVIRGLYVCNYFDMNRAVGVLEMVKQELYRKTIATYEDLKETENGKL